MIEVGLGILAFLIAGFSVGLMVIALDVGRGQEVADHDSSFDQPRLPG